MLLLQQFATTTSPEKHSVVFTPHNAGRAVNTAAIHLLPLVLIEDSRHHGAILAPLLALIHRCIRQLEDDNRIVSMLGR